MSRLIVKNIPKRLSKETFANIFAEYGAVTDAKLVYKSNGKFRGFGFVGYKSADEAQLAIKSLNNSLVLNQKITIEICKSLISEQNRNVPLKQNEDNQSEEVIDQPTNLNDNDFLKFKKVKDIHDDFSDDEEKKEPQQNTHQFSCVMQGFPSKTKDDEITNFFYPTKPLHVKITRVKRRIKGQVVVSFENKKDFDIAMKLNGECLSGRKIKLDILSEQSEKNSVKSKKEKRFTSLNENDVEQLADSGRLFVRNLPFICTENDLEKCFTEYGPIVEVHMPIDSLTHKPIGIGFITYMMPEHAVKAYQKLDGSVFMGRMLHILPAKSKPENQNELLASNSNDSNFKKDKLRQQKKSSQNAYNWNSLFMGTDAVASAISEKYDISKMDFLNSDDKSSSAVRLALGESQVVQETRQFLLDNDISLDAFSQPDAPRSKTVILVKNMTVGVSATELRKKFDAFGELGRVVLAPAGITAVIEFVEPSHARQAFVKLAYRKFHNKPLYLEWAPVGTFLNDFKPKEAFETKVTEKMEVDENKDQQTETFAIEKDDSGHESESIEEEGTLLFVKNLNFETTEDALKTHFSLCGKLDSATISKKLGSKKEVLSMGYGFVKYTYKKDATKAIKELQKSMLDNHQLEIKLSTRTPNQMVKNNPSKKKQKIKKQMSSKILVRNVPFQANKKEIGELFKTFGDLKSLRLPTKLTGSTEKGKHRGFAFVDFISKQDAKKAFNALCHSTHLYGRRLVLEWADTDDDTVETLRRKTAENFNKKSKKSRTIKQFEDTVILQSAKLVNDEE